MSSFIRVKHKNPRTGKRYGKVKGTQVGPKLRKKKDKRTSKKKKQRYPKAYRIHRKRMQAKKKNGGS